MNIENKWKNMDAEKSSFIVEKCERVMECVIADRELLQKKANLILGLVGGVATLALGVWLDPKRNLPEIVERALGIEILLLLVAGVVAILTCLMPSKYAAPGGDPKLMLQPEFANQEMTWLRIGYCVLLQKGIDLNLKRNQRIAVWIRIVAVFVFVSPVLAHFGQKLIPQRPATPAMSPQSALNCPLERCSEAVSSRLGQRYSTGPTDWELLPERELEPAVEVRPELQAARNSVACCFQS